MNARPFTSLAFPVLAGASALAVLALPQALAQAGGGESAPEPARPRTLIRVGAPQAVDEQVEPALDCDEWTAALSDPDLDRRLAAFEDVVSRASRDGEAREFLEGLAAGSGELAWTAKLALRDLDRAAPRGPFGVWHGAKNLDDVERMLEEFTQRVAPGWNHRIDPLVIPFPGLTPQTPLIPGGSAQSRRVDVRNDADGWTIKITEDADGEESVREYSGETLEEILEANPELKDEVGISGSLVGPGMSLRIGSPSDRTFDFDALFGNLGVRPAPENTFRSAPRTLERDDPVRTDILGVVARPATADEGGRGLHVRSTVPGSIAALLGIEGGDVLLSVNGRELATIDDVTEALQARGEDGRIEAAWIDSYGRRRSGTWRPE